MSRSSAAATASGSWLAVGGVWLTRVSVKTVCYIPWHGPVRAVL